MAVGNNNHRTSNHSYSDLSNNDTNPYSFNRPSLFSGNHSFASRRPAANALPSFQLPLPPFQLQPPVQPQPFVPPFQQQVPPTPPIDSSDYIGSRVAASDGISQLPSGNSAGFNNSCFPNSQVEIGYLPPNTSGPLLANPNTLTPNTPGAQSALMQPNYGRPPYSPTTPGYQGSQSSDGLPHHSYDGVASSFSLPAPGRSGGHSSMQHTLQNPMNAHTQGAQPSPTTTTASSDSFARSSNSTYYHSASATSHPLSYPGFTPSVAAPTHTAPSTTGTYSRSISAYSQQSQNHSVPSSPMQAPYSSRSYPNYTTLPTMAGPVLSNMSNPGGQMALVGGMGTMSPGYSHHIGQHQMYSNSQHNLHSDRPFKCDTCNSGFNRNHDLKRHTRIHLAIKPFPCTFCDKSFSRKDALKRHRLVKGCGSRNDSNDGNDNSPPDEIKPEDDDTTGPLQALRG